MKQSASEEPRGRLALQHPASGDDIPEDCGIISIHLSEMVQLFDPMDPSPFREKDLDPKAEEYIIESIRELPSGKLCALLVYIDQPPGLPDEGNAAGQAIRLHFSRRSQILQRKFRILIRRGLISLAIGLAFLAAVLVLAENVGGLLGESHMAALLSEGLLIVGWVAMWRPLEIFLYDWWPIAGERRMHDRLSRIRVRIVYTARTL
jgi:hypothetical protein